MLRTLVCKYMQGVECLSALHCTAIACDDVGCGLQCLWPHLSGKRCNWVLHLSLRCCCCSVDLRSVTLRFCPFFLPHLWNLAVGFIFSLRGIKTGAKRLKSNYTVVTCFALHVDLRGKMWLSQYLLNFQHWLP